MEVRIYTSGQPDPRGGFNPTIHLCGSEIIVGTHRYDMKELAEECANEVLLLRFKKMLVGLENHDRME